MSLLSHPAFGRPVRVVVPLILSFGFAACSRQADPTTDGWKLTPPTIELTDSKGASVSANASAFQSSKLSSDSSVFADELANLRFASQDLGLYATFKTRCSGGDRKSAEFQQNAKTATRISILAILPPEILSPSSLSRDWFCDIEMIVTNSVGSVSRGRLLGVKVRLASSVARLASEETGGANLTTVRLVCPTWWTEGSFEDLHALASVKAVQGLDNRASERTPWCTVLSLGESPKLAQIMQPLEKTPNFSVAPESLFAKTRTEDLYARPLIALTIRNETPFTKVLFVPNPKPFVKISVKTSMDRTPTWTRPINAGAVFTHNAKDSQQNDQGLFMRLTSGETVRVQLSGSRRDLISFADFSKPTESTHLMVLSAPPIEISTLANEREIGPMISADLSRLRRENLLGANTQMLLDKAVLETSPSNFLAMSNVDGRQALAAGPVNSSCFCFIGPAGMVMNEPAN